VRREGERREPRPIGDLFRGQVLGWARDLRVAGFTDEQAARLIYARLLYIAGHLPR
jgi:hypothetical protein